MASRFVVVLALIAVCHSSPVINGVEYRNKRSYTVGEGSSSSYNGGSNKASAAINGRNVQVDASSDNLARDALGNGLPGQAYVKAATYDDAPYGTEGIGKAQPAYYPVPAPATVIAYQQYADVPAETPSQLVYQQAPSVAQSTATINGGYGSAASKADTTYRNGAAVSNANVHGNGYGSASSLAHTSGLVTPVASPEDFESTIVAAKTQGLNTVYTPAYTPVGSASSNANANGQYSSAASTAQSGGVPTRKSISWRFGTAYDNPASYVRSAPSNYGSVKSAAQSNGAASALSSANSNGADFGSANSVANSNGGRADANAYVNNAGYASLRSNDNGAYGTVKSSANTNGYGYANSNANINNNGYGFRNAGWGSSATDAHARGSGNAVSSARTQGLSTGYKVVNSAVKSDGPGSDARATAYSN